METEPTPQSSSESQSEPLETGSEILVSKPGTLAHEIEKNFLDGKDLNKKMLQIEKAILFVALSKCGWNKAAAARMCGLNRTTLMEKVRKHGMMKAKDDAADI